MFVHGPAEVSQMKSSCWQRTASQRLKQPRLYLCITLGLNVIQTVSHTAVLNGRINMKHVYFWSSLK